MHILVVDVGMGTNDVLFWDSVARGENQIHLIVPSATKVVAGEIREATRRGLPVVFRGALMGGGPSTAAMSDHLATGLPFYADPGAARTFSDDLHEVADMGVRIVEEAEAAALAAGRAVDVRSGDLRASDLLEALRLLGVRRVPDGYAIAVQDHGEAPPGVSDRVFRFERLVELFSPDGRLERLFFEPAAIPAWFTRMKAAAGCLPADAPCVVGDTGPSALWGAALAAEGRDCLAVNYGNGHTIASFIRGDAVDGLFEHHTGKVGRESMADYLRRFAQGTLASEEVLADDGHGVWSPSAPVDLGELPVMVTGPNRARFSGAVPREVEASMHGDMMLSGCWGLLEGYKARFGLD